MAIHPTAMIDPRTRIADGAEIGPYAVIDGDVEIGEGCRIGPHVHLTGVTRVGPRNRFDTGCVIGGRPQDLRYDGSPTRLVIGEGNTFREHVTVHCANRLDEETRIGNGCLLMAHCHVGHNAHLGDGVIVANGAQVAGHVDVGNRAFISGNCLIHQFVRVGSLALMQGGSAISKDLPPFCVARGDNGVCGLNVIGLRRAGLEAGVRLELRQIYHALFRTGRGMRAALEMARSLVKSDWGRLLVEFVAESRRGVVSERRRGRVDE